MDLEDPSEKSTFEFDSADEGPPYIGLSRDHWIGKYVSLFSPDSIAVATNIVQASQLQDLC
jgi:hypothetical protein